MAQSNEDRLKVPAFLRKSGIRKKASKPLLLTALDRKRAGVKVGDTKKKRKRAAAGKSPKVSRRRSLAAQSFGSRSMIVAGGGFVGEPLLGDVLIDDEFSGGPVSRHSAHSALACNAAPVFDDGQEFICIGRMTHYFDGICVGVLELVAPIRVGEYILFEVDGGLCGQRITSMQCDKRDISLGKTGMEIGLKLAGAPAVGGKVYKM